MYCSKCGSKIPEGGIYCSKCGAKIDDGTLIGEEKITDNINSSNVKRKPFIPIIIAVLACLAFLVYFLISNGGKEEYFANIPWGTDIQDVKTKAAKYFKRDVITGDKNHSIIVTIENYLDMDGVTAAITFNCDEDDKLDNIFILATVVDDDANYTDKEIFENMTKEYKKKYGEYHIKSDIIREWKTTNSTIDLLIFEDGMIVSSIEQP